MDTLKQKWIYIYNKRIKMKWGKFEIDGDTLLWIVIFVSLIVYGIIVSK